MTHTDDVALRVATPDDVKVLNRLIQESARELSVGFYSAEQTESAIRWVFGVDSALVADGSYFVAEIGGALAGCGGWSRRRTLYGGDQRPVGGPAFLDPATDAARVRAFFVAPNFVRHGVGTALLDACADAAWHAGFRKLELMATLPGVPLYRTRGFEGVEEVSDPLPDGTLLPFVRMTRALTSPPSGRLRAARGGDADSVSRLHIASWQSAYRGLLPDSYLDALDPAVRGEEWREIIEGGQASVVLRDVIGAGVVAFCAVGRSRDEGATDSTWEVWNLHAAPNARGNGYGAELFEDALRIARSAGGTELTLWVARENGAARRFYERRGMHADGACTVHVFGGVAELPAARYRMAIAGSEQLVHETMTPQAGGVDA
ncbi:MAG: GNAT family N-acetyltransferase [Gemmatimonadaceae bacterium]